MKDFFLSYHFDSLLVHLETITLRLMESGYLISVRIK